MRKKKKAKPSIIINPVNVIITVAIANTINIINGNAKDRMPADTPKAKYGCLAKCRAILSSNT